jgi:hypothetical protein
VKRLHSILPIGFAAATAVAFVLVAVSLTLAAGSADAEAPPHVLDTSSPFSHDHHLNVTVVGKDLTCASCHEMATPTGACPQSEVRFPTHESCAGCHTANFYTPQMVKGTMTLTICANCHQSSSFTKNNPLKELGRQVTPRKAEFSHKTHDGSACTECHAMQKAGAFVSHPSHPNCCQCHSDGTVQPTMNRCESCHSASQSAGRPRSKVHSFSHKSHNVDPRNGRSMECTQCHVNTAFASSLRTLAAPPMSSCVGCHDGSEPGKPHPTIPGVNGSGAFHFTACLRCHIPGSIQGVPPPPGHPTETATGRP